MKIKVHTINSFIKTNNGGNTAGVVLEGDAFSESQMQKIASIAGFSETAFIMKSEVADFKIRFFTPSDEVDLCGYATVASFCLLAEIKAIAPGVYSQETKAGTLSVEVDDKGTIYMNQVLPKFYEFVDRHKTAESLGMAEKDLVHDLPVQIVSTGLKDIFVPVKSLKTLLDLKPDFDMIAELSKNNGVIGIHAFSTESKFNSTAHCRNFAPLYGIPEESATGMSNGALACYLFKHGKIATGEEKQMVFEQGYSMDSPSEIVARLDTIEKEIVSIQVGGKAVVTDVLNIKI